VRRLLLLAGLFFALTLAVATAAEAATGTIDPSAKLSADRTTATITGTLSCNPLVSGVGMISANVQEVVGRLPIQGFGSGFGLACTGTPQPWSLTTQAAPLGATYVPGPASVTVIFNAFGGLFPPIVDSWLGQSTVRLLP
jgi:hypothetical protein